MRDVFRSVFSHHADRLTGPEDYINHSLYFEVKTFLHGLLVVEDKLSMASSLETRLPFLDNDLVEFAQALPVNLKLANLGEVVPAQRERAWAEDAAVLRQNTGRQADLAAPHGALRPIRRGGRREAGILSP